MTTRQRRRDEAPDGPQSEMVTERHQADPAPARWFLHTSERGNAFTRIDQPAPWSTGNAVELHVDGAEYFRRLAAEIQATLGGDSVWFTDWESQRDELIGGHRLDDLLFDAVRRGVVVRGLVWRSHPRRAHFSEPDNAAFARELNEAGAEILLDERVRRGGCHHQKLVIVRRRDAVHGPVGFVGGIDLCHGRNDDRSHLGDPQAVVLDPCYGSVPPWHDTQLEVRGPAVAALMTTFEERWNDRTPLDHRNPWRSIKRRIARQPSAPPDPITMHARPPVTGDCAAQVLRTYPAKRPPFPFAPQGERSVARGLLKAFATATRLVYIEDQYFWSASAADSLAAALRRAPDLLVVVVVPRYPDRDSRLAGAASHMARAAAIERLEAAGPGRVAVYDLENRNGTPIYVHSKVCIVDDVWMAAGSDNVNVRSWTHDSEVSCATIDSTRDERAPRDPGRLGEGARVLARDARVRLACEHLGRSPADDADLVDPAGWFAAFARAADTLDGWHRTDQRGPRPAPHVRNHQPEHVPVWLRPWAHLAYRWVVDPDGRPRDERARDGY